MRRLLLCIAAFLLVGSFAVYATGKPETTGAAQPAAAAGPLTLEITKAYFFDGGDVTQNPDEKEAYLAWFKQKYGITLKVNAYPRPEFMEKFILAMSSGQIKGLGWIFGGSYMMDFYNDGATEALDEYVKDNKVWNSLPKDMRETNVRNGKLIAIPSNWAMGNWFARTIRTDWLAKLGMKKPQTIEEFYEVVKAFTTKDPDGNGKADTVGMTSSGVWNIQDIFHAFDVHTNHVGDHCVTLDPNDGLRYVDGMLKPGMADCLAWLADCYKNGYLDKEIWTNTGANMRDRMSSGLYGSCYYWRDWAFSWETNAKKVDPNATCDIIYGLTSKYAKTYTNPGNIYNGQPYVLIKGSADAKRQVNAFIDIFLGDREGYWSGRYGVPGQMWTLTEKNEIFRYAKTFKDGKPATYYSGPGIAGGDMPNFNHLLFPMRLEGEDPANVALRNQRNALLDRWTKEAVASKLMYSYPHYWSEPMSPLYLKITSAEIKRVFVQEVTKAVTGQITPQEAIANYKKEIGALGGQAMLDEANRSIGKTTNPNYKY